MMNIAARFSLSKKLRFMSVRRRADNTTEGDADWLSNTPTRAPFTTLVDSSLANSNACRRGETTYAMGWLKWGPN
jgi:hypothetical protein